MRTQKIEQSSAPQEQAPASTPPRSAPSAGVPSGRQVRTAAAAQTHRPTETGGGSPMPPPYGNEPPDYERYRYGYPPGCGRMFGSGN